MQMASQSQRRAYARLPVAWRLCVLDHESFPAHSSYALYTTKCLEEARRRGDQVALLDWNKVWSYGCGCKLDVISVSTKHVSVDGWTVTAFSTGEQGVNGKKSWSGRG